MLKTILRFAGFSPPAPPPRPPSKRRVAPQGKRPVAPPPAPVVPVEDPVAAKQAWAREVCERDRSRAFALAVNILAREADASDMRFVDRGDLARARCVVPDNVQAYLRARVLAGGRIPTLYGNDLMTDSMAAAFRAELHRLAETDFEVWTAGLAAFDRAKAAAGRHGQAGPEPIEVPASVEDGIAKLAADKARRLTEQAARRKGGNGGSGTPPGGVSDTPPVAPTTVVKKGDEDKPEGNEPPAGPRR